MNVYEIVASRILDQMAQGNIPWKKPWVDARPSHNRITQKEYSLLNQLLLADKPPGEYASARQWMSLNGRIRSGEKPSIVVFWKMEEKPRPDEQEKEISDGKTVRFVLRFHKIYHVSQVDGVDPLETYFTYPTHPIVESEDLFKKYASRENICFENDLTNRGAFYSPQLDMIHMPHLSQFHDVSGIDHAQVLWHECVHSTGHSRRLNRPGLRKVTFGSETYSREELTAELGSCFILNKLGLLKDYVITNSAAYIQGWSRFIKNDPKAFVKAAADAEKAVNYIFNN